MIPAWACALAVAASPAATSPSLPKGATPVLAAMRAELDHSLGALKREPVAPYFLSYEITETQTVSVGSSFGALVFTNEGRSRALDIDLRVGDYALDNTHPVRGGRGSTSDRSAGSAPIPTDDAPDAIRAVLWYQTDRKYKRAVEQLTKVKTNVQVKVEEEDKSADFCAEPAQVFAEAAERLAVDRKVWENKLRAYTAPFAKYGDLYDARAELSAGRDAMVREQRGDADPGLRAELPSLHLCFLEG